MAKRKSSKTAPRNSPTVAPPTLPLSAAVARKPAPSSPNATSWGWLVGGLVGVGVLMSLALFFLPGEEPGVAAEVPTPAPLPTATPRPMRPADAPAGIVDYCKRSPHFRDSEGFSSRSVLSTIERGVKGASLIDLDANGQVVRSYQHPSWDDAGYLGHVQLDRHGNVYAFPAPYVSLVDNPPDLQNILYRIDSITAEMTRFYTLTAAAPATGENPFGMMGIAYDCDTESLYASSVAGSTRASTNGQIVRIDLPTRTVRFIYEGIDAFGLGLYITAPLSGTVQGDAQATGKRLYYGLVRTPEIYSIGVDDAGDLLDDARLEITLPDPTLKARRLLFARDGTLEVRSRPFDFNLIVTSERPEVLFSYRFDQQKQQWQLVER